MAAPGENIRFMGVDSSLVDLTEKKSSKGNNKTEYFSLTDLNTNFANTDLTFTAARAHNTAGFSLEVTTDAGVYGESWFVLQSTQNEFGFANTWHRYLGTTLETRANNILLTTHKLDGIYNKNVTAPSAADANTYVQYANDIVAGNSAPHFKTENGDVVKLYKESAVTTVQGIADALANQGLLAASTMVDGGYTYTEVSVSSAEIKNLFAAPKQLLAAPGANTYYDIDKIAIEYTFVTTDYTVVEPLVIRDTDNYLWTFITETLISDGQSLYGVYREFFNWAVDGNTPANPVLGVGAVNKGIELSTSTTSPTLGDGTLLVKIWYKVKTFGTEL